MRPVNVRNVALIVDVGLERREGLKVLFAKTDVPALPPKVVTQIVV
jgi:hypothetical protein